MRARDKARHAALDGRSCVACGLSDWRVLVFHHRDPATKVAKLNQMWRNPGRYDIDAEINKCDVLCHNCHALLHTNLPEHP